MSINLKTYYLKACNLYANYSQFTIHNHNLTITIHNSQLKTHNQKFTITIQNSHSQLHSLQVHNSQLTTTSSQSQFTIHTSLQLTAYVDSCYHKEVDKYLKLTNKLRHYAFMETVKPKTAYLNLV